LEEIGMVDIAVVPIGNSGYTLDAVGALKIIKQIEPKVVIPTHFADKDIKYEVPQVELRDALKNLGMESGETLDKYKYKPSDLTDAMKLVVLNR
jgi:L-ascorbate metabolism protein UlaG (beta-lactamase superfamily)